MKIFLLIPALLLIPNITLAVGPLNPTHTQAKTIMLLALFLAVISILSILAGYLLSKANEFHRKSKTFYSIEFILLTISVIAYGIANVIQQNADKYLY